jgi:hypothetical protein
VQDRAHRRRGDEAAGVSGEGGTEVVTALEEDAGELGPIEGGDGAGDAEDDAAADSFS